MNPSHDLPTKTGHYFVSMASKHDNRKIQCLATFHADTKKFDVESLGYVIIGWDDPL